MKYHNKTVLIIGGGMSGITAALEAAETGYEVMLIEKNPYLGGRVAQHYKYFPKLCPPYCGLEINFRRIKSNPKIRFYTEAELLDISGNPGDFHVKIKQHPRYVNQKCTSCSLCSEACPVEMPNDFNFGMDKTKAIYLPHDMAFPARYVINDNYCKGSECAKCVDVCKYDAIELDMKEKTVEFDVSSIVFATGWDPYDATKIDNLSFGKVKNVITNMMFERLASLNGPTKGKIVRSDGKEVKNIAFVQCAGSRDENHLNYCSAICCMSSLKEATYLREQNPDSKVTIFYIDLRTPGKYEDFLKRIEADENIRLVKGKVAKIEQEQNGDVTVTVEDILNLKKLHERFDMVVLATGMMPKAKWQNLPIDISFEENGFMTDQQQDGIYAAGVTKMPSDVASSVQDATAAALKSIQTVRRIK